MTYMPLSNAAPSGEAVAAAPGNVGRSSREDHQHPRLTSTTMGTIGAAGTATMTFTRSFASAPGMVFTEINGSATQPAVFKVDSWVMTGPLYTGCVVRAWRSQTIPQNLVSLLVSAVFNLFGASANGTAFSCIAVARSDAP